MLLTSHDESRVYSIIWVRGVYVLIWESCSILIALYIHVQVGLSPYYNAEGQQASKTHLHPCPWLFPAQFQCCMLHATLKNHKRDHASWKWLSCIAIKYESLNVQCHAIMLFQVQIPIDTAGVLSVATCNFWHYLLHWFSWARFSLLSIVWPSWNHWKFNTILLLYRWVYEYIQKKKTLLLFWYSKPHIYLTHPP